MIESDSAFEAGRSALLGDGVLGIRAAFLRGRFRWARLKRLGPQLSIADRRFWAVWWDCRCSGGRYFFMTEGDVSAVSTLNHSGAAPQPKPG